MLLRLYRSAVEVFFAGQIGASHICHPKSPPALSVSGVSFGTKPHLQKVTTLSSALAGMLSCVTVTLMKDQVCVLSSS